MLPIQVLISVAAVIVALSVGFVIRRQRRANERQKTTPDSPFCDSFDVSDLAQRLQTPLEFLQNLTPQYRVAEVRKPRGGVRRLEIPDDATKELQRKILRLLLNRLEAHPFACGFEQHTSIVDAALPHQNKALVLKVDIRRFFESTSADRVHDYLRGIGWTAEATAILVKLMTYNGHLPQGSPTSPRLSNLVNAPMDEGLLRLATKHGGSYSRYADDVTMSFGFSGGRRARGVVQAVRRIMRSYGYSMHGGRKLRIHRQHQQQNVLGLVVNSQVALPRKTRRWLRAVRHRMDTTGHATVSAQQLHGWESLAKMVETQRVE